MHPETRSGSGRHGRELRGVGKASADAEADFLAPVLRPDPSPPGQTDRQTGAPRDLPGEKRSAESFLLPLPRTVLIRNQILSFLEQEPRLIIHSVFSVCGTQWGSVSGGGYRTVSGSTLHGPSRASASVSLCISIRTRVHMSEVGFAEHLNSTLSPFSFLPPPQETRGLEASAPG